MRPTFRIRKLRGSLPEGASKRLGDRLVEYGMSNGPDGGRYDPPLVHDLGRLTAITLGQFFSRADGCSGNTGDKGVGDPACD